MIILKVTEYGSKKSQSYTMTHCTNLNLRKRKSRIVFRGSREEVFIGCGIILKIK